MGGPHHGGHSRHGAGTHSPSHRPHSHAAHHIIHTARRKILIVLFIAGIIANRAPVLYAALQRLANGIFAKHGGPGGNGLGPGGNSPSSFFGHGVLGVLVRFFARVAEGLSNSRKIVSHVWPPSVDLIVKHGMLWTGSLAAMVVVFYTRSLRQGGKGLEASISESMRFERSERRKACLEVGGFVRTVWWIFRT